MTREHLRIIDASANRAREGLRVMEDGARFLLDDAPLCARIKQARHDLAAALQSTLADAILTRDTGADVGTAVTTPSEMTRKDHLEVIIAAGKRVGEALRSIEEWAKIDSAAVSAAVEKIRYAAYDIERDLVIAMGSRRVVRWKLMVLITESLCAHHSWHEVSRLAIEGGADCLQLREKEFDGRELVSRAQQLVELARPFGAQVIVNDRADVAIASSADGVHIGQSDLSVRDARQTLGMDRIVGVSTTNIEQARQALRRGADYCGVGPMFETTTKQSPGGRTEASLAGPAYLREYLAHEPKLPHPIAIGGIDAGNVCELSTEDEWGVAVSAAVCGAEDPKGVCEQILRKQQEKSGTASAGAGA
jgi:thiamine-phosphate pyrophosphorylase